jgi:hypothetical protein
MTIEANIAMLSPNLRPSRGAPATAPLNVLPSTKTPTENAQRRRVKVALHVEPTRARGGSAGIGGVVIPTEFGTMRSVGYAPAALGRILLWQRGERRYQTP